MNADVTGWLLDVYPGPEGDPAARDGVVVWLLGEDGLRRRLYQPFPITFYAAGEAHHLRSLWKYLEAQPVAVKLARTERRDLFSDQPLTVLSVEVLRPAEQPRLFREVASGFPYLTYFDADVPLTLRYAARCGVFPLARCRASLEAGPPDLHGELLSAIELLDSPWDLDPEPPPLRTLFLEPDIDPSRAPPQHLLVRFEQAGAQPVTYRLGFHPPRPLLVNLAAILKRHDPDLLLTAWGDTWLLPRLLALSTQLDIPLPLNRDPYCAVEHRKEVSYFSYGQVVYRGQQAHLFGRWHVDRHNAMLWGDYELEGVLELARVTAQPLQVAARVSPGTGISAMQMLTALRQEILVPWHKQQVEYAKPALSLFSSDQGGLVYQPLVGLHRDVAGIDFVSMYPGIMVRFNISPETVTADRPDPGNLVALESPQATGEPGLIPQTLSPLLNKRLALKSRLASLPRWDPRRKAYQARATAHKWLLVTCFGYLGYKNARFGRIEAHEAVTAYGREALLRAKEIAEDLGFTVLHMYVDGLWVQKPGCSASDDFQALLDAVSLGTGLPISLDGIYRWVAFLPSRVDEQVPVPNRYFGVFQDGTLKVRGIEARRRDTPAFITATQTQILEMLARAPDAGRLAELVPHAIRLLRRKIAELRAGRVPLDDLVVGQRLSREIEEYRTPSPAARAAAQLLAVGKSTRPGQRVRFVYMRGDPGVHAWNLPEAPDPAGVDAARYIKLLLRAASAVLGPLGLSEVHLQRLVLEGVTLLELPAPQPRRARIQPGDGSPAAALPARLPAPRVSLPA